MAYLLLHLYFFFPFDTCIEVWGQPFDVGANCGEAKYFKALNGTNCLIIREKVIKWQSIFYDSDYFTWNSVKNKCTNMLPEEVVSHPQHCWNPFSVGGEGSLPPWAPYRDTAPWPCWGPVQSSDPWPSIFLFQPSTSKTRENYNHLNLKVVHLIYMVLIITVIMVCYIQYCWINCFYQRNFVSMQGTKIIRLNVRIYFFIMHFLWTWNICTLPQIDQSKLVSKISSVRIL